MECIELIERPSKSALKKARKIHAQRPKKAREVDNSLMSHVTKHLEVWKSDPSRWDMLGVDTPKKKKRGMF